MKQHAPGFLALVQTAKKSIQETNVAEISARIKNGDCFHFIDVREDDEWREGHAKGAVHLGKGVIERDIEAEIPDKSAEIVLYCGGGFRSALAAETLMRMGYTHVVSMDGGFRAWAEAGLPVEK
ncbi:MAG: rhodanese-like domain-containing protein [Oligoflexia bacterium]